MLLPQSLKWSDTTTGTADKRVNCVPSCNNIIKWGNKTFMANLHNASKDCSNKQLSKFTSGSKHCDAAARNQMHFICNIHFQIRHVTSFLSAECQQEGTIWMRMTWVISALMMLWSSLTMMTTTTHWSYLANHLRFISGRLADLSDLLPHLSASVHPSIEEHYCKNRPSKNINAFPGFHYCCSLCVCIIYPEWSAYNNIIVCFASFSIMYSEY